jgi:uncharacterized protein (DUF433 family)
MTLLTQPPNLSPQDLAGDLIQPNHPLFGLIWINPERLSGAPCFSGTRVPIKNLFDYLEGGDPISEFMEDFPDISHEQIQAVISLAAQGLLDKLPRP